MILHLRQTFGGGGGADRVIVNTFGHFDTQRFPMHVALLHSKYQDITPILSEMRASNIQCSDIPGTRFFDWAQFNALRQLINEKNIRLIHSHDPKVDVLARLLRLFHPRLKLVSTAHGWIGGTRKSDFYIRLDLMALRSFDRVFAVSKRNADIARAAGVRRVEVIHNGIDTAEWRPEPSAGSARPFTIGFVGRLSQEKGALDFVRLAQMLLKQDPQMEFLVAGEGPQSAEMRQLAMDLGVSPRMQFLGLLNQAELKQAYRKMDLLALTSVTEGLPMNILEACAMEIPVAAYAVGGIAEIIEHGQNGYLADYGRMEELAEAILKLAADGEQCRRLGQAARWRVEQQFSIQLMVTRIMSHYAELLD